MVVYLWDNKWNRYLIIDYFLTIILFEEINYKITKSGIYHRLNKINQIVGEL